MKYFAFSSKKAAHLFFIFIGSFLPLTTCFSQGLIPESDKYLREYENEFVLLEKHNPVFSGYYLTSFERPNLIWNDGARMKWLREHEYKKPYALRTSLQFLSLRERPAVVGAIGSKEFPVTYSSLLEGSQGIRPRYGENSYATLDAEASPSDWSFFKLKIHGGGGFKEPKAWYFVQEFYTELRLCKLVLSVGRKSIHWGQSWIGPLLYSDNARSLDLIELSTIPLEWPGFLNVLGKLKAEVFLSRLDDRRVPKNDWFAGWRLGLKPSDWFEGNMGMTYEFSGKGMPEIPTSTYLIELLGVRRSFSSAPNDSSFGMKHVFMGDLRFNLQNIYWPTSIYTEQHLWDCCGDIGLLIKNTLSYTFGVLTRTSEGAGAHRFHLEYSKTGTSYYFHKLWPSASSNGGRLAADPLGRDAQGVYFVWEKDFVPRNFELSFSSFWEERGRKGILLQFDEGGKTPITDYQPDFKHAEKRLGFSAGSKILAALKTYLDLRGEIVSVHRKENSDRDTVEWGVFSGVSRNW
ncbi:MAG: hypothetical protein JWQ35_595 [Bacteriovoracaceae bacterium]|nr:hypothetical protein [Bacteriovoracaceae bacterium]